MQKNAAVKGEKRYEIILREMQNNKIEVKDELLMIEQGQFRCMNKYDLLAVVIQIYKNGNILGALREELQGNIDYLLGEFI